MLNQQQLFKGITEIAVLSTLAEGPHYGLQILDRLRTEAGVEVAEGSIYPILHRLEKTGAISAEWRLDSDAPRPRKYYQLTKTGTADLQAAHDAWRKISDTLGRFLNRSKP